MLIDSHAHLNDRRLAPEIDSIVGNMQSDGLLAIVNVGFDYESSLLAYEQASQHKNVYAVLGVHPHDAKTAVEQQFLHIETLASDPKVVAIGECGLDYYYDLSPRETQKAVCERQLQLAKKTDLPVVIHCRDSYEDMYTLLYEHMYTLKSSGVMHCYSGSVEMAKKFLDLGLYLSFGGVITFKNAKKAIDVLNYAPVDRILLETDCPYLTPEPFRGRLNYPKYVNLVAQRLAEAWGVSLDSVCNQTTKNCKALFTKIK